MELQDLLYSQGFGTRRVCVGLVQKGWVRVQIDGQWQTCEDPWWEVDAQADWPFEVLCPKPVMQTLWVPAFGSTPQPS